MTTEEQTTEQPQDLHSVLSSAFDAVESKGKTEEKPAPKAEAPKEDAKAEETHSEADGGGEATATPSDAESGSEKSADEKPDEKPEQKPLEAPAHWPAQDKAAFAKAPPEMQQAWLRRDKEVEAGLTKKTQEIAAFRRDWEPVDKLFSPWRDAMKQRGFTNESLIQSWMNAELALMKGGDNAYNLLGTVVKQYKLDPAELARRLGVSAQPQQANGEAREEQNQLPAEITAALRPVLAEINGVKQWITKEQQDRYQNEAGRVMKQIQDFSEAKDDKGNLLHPYFPDVENIMAQQAGLVKARGESPNLQELYDQAVWANTSIREKLLADRSAADEAQRKAMAEKQAKEARAKAEAARKASKPVSGAPGSGQPPSTSRQAGRSLRDEIMAAAEDAEA